VKGTKISQTQAELSTLEQRTNVSLIFISFRLFL
jgi:hypothetical protein